ADKLIIGPLVTDIQAEFNINDTDTGAIATWTLLVAALLYPVWGYLYDRFARAKLIALASLIWGMTTSLSAIVTNFGAFSATRASTGIDDSSYPGVYSLVSDYFGPGIRGKIYGILQLTAPLGYLIGLVLALMLAPMLGGWRGVFLLTGGLGIILSVIIFFTVRDVARGKSEPELEQIAEVATFKFSWKEARALFKRRALIPLFVQGFFGVFPLNIFSFWFFTYLERERGMDDAGILPLMGFSVVVMAIGAFVGGWLGDWLFKRTKRGRLIVGTTGVLMGSALMFISLNIPAENSGLFNLFLPLTAFFVLFAGPNIVSTIYDITVPEVRSTALSIQYFIEQFGAASAPLLVGFIADRSNLTNGIMIVALSTWVLCGLFQIIALLVIPKDITDMHNQLKARAEAFKPA
ncbi:MAG TPA: MFS transporter, partial [Aggregatilineales bacterium]|nr:MFS transporter [Aggregatilineales bacterium]